MAFAQIAFYSNRTGHYEVWIIQPDGSELRQLTHNSPWNVSTPLRSPDGTRLAYTAYGRGAVVIEPGKPWKEQAPQVVAQLREPNVWFWAWSWSPDGRELAGTRMRGDPVGSGVVVYLFDSRRFQQVTARGAWPVWLSDSRRLLFVQEGKIYLADTRRARSAEDGWRRQHPDASSESEDARPAPGKG
jgi:Tol biopolymer transport system component